MKSRGRKVRIIVGVLFSVLFFFFTGIFFGIVATVGDWFIDTSGTSGGNGGYAVMIIGIISSVIGGILGAILGGLGGFYFFGKLWDNLSPKINMPLVFLGGLIAMLVCIFIVGSITLG